MCPFLPITLPTRQQGSITHILRRTVPTDLVARYRHHLCDVLEHAARFLHRLLRLQRNDRLSELMRIRYRLTSPNTLKLHVSSSTSMPVIPGTSRAFAMFEPCVPMAKPISSLFRVNRSTNLSVWLTLMSCVNERVRLRLSLEHGAYFDLLGDLLRFLDEFCFRA